MSFEHPHLSPGCRGCAPCARVAEMARSPKPTSCAWAASWPPPSRPTPPSAVTAASPRTRSRRPGRRPGARRLAPDADKVGSPSSRGPGRRRPSDLYQLGATLLFAASGRSRSRRACRWRPARRTRPASAPARELMEWLVAPQPPPAGRSRRADAASGRQLNHVATGTAAAPRYAGVALLLTSSRSGLRRLPPYVPPTSRHDAPGPGAGGAPVPAWPSNGARHRPLP